MPSFAMSSPFLPASVIASPAFLAASKAFYLRQSASQLSSTGVFDAPNGENSKVP